MTTLRKQGELRQRKDEYHSPAYQKHIARQPCEACSNDFPGDDGYVCQAAHIRIGFHTTARKPSDRHLISLCSERGNSCHQKFDAGQERFIREVWDMTVQERIDLSDTNWTRWAVT